MRLHLIVLILVIGVFSGYSIAGAENNQWNESRQFERSLEKSLPDMTRYIISAHISEQGLEVQVSPFYPINMHERNRFYKQVGELWENSELVKAKKYPGRVRFMQLDKPLKTVD